MATIEINGTELQPQPAWDAWEDVITNGNLNGTDGLGAYKLFRMQSPPLAGQVFNWDNFENQELVSLQTYAPGELPTSANIIYSAGVVSRKIARYESPLDRSVINIELVIQVIV